MKKTITYIMIAVLIILIGGLVFLKFSYKDSKKVEEESPQKKVPEVVAIQVRHNHATKDGENFKEDWLLIENSMAIRNNDTVSFALNKNAANEEPFIKDINIKENQVSFQLMENNSWKEINLDYNKEYKYLSGDYRYTNIVFHKLNIDNFEILSNDTLSEKTFYEAYDYLSQETRDDKLGSYKINSLEELQNIANNELVENYKDYDFSNKSLYVIKSYGNKENNCYKRDLKVTISLLKDKKLHLVQEKVQEAETNCMAVLTDIKYRVFELSGKYEDVLIESIIDYIEKPKAF